MSDAIDNRIVAIPDALTRTDSAGTGRTVTKDGLIATAAGAGRDRRRAICSPPTARTGSGRDRSRVRQAAAAQWIDANQAQSPPGNGDLFGLAMAPDGSGFYYVEDDMNMLAKATP